MHFNYIPMMSD